MAFIDHEFDHSGPNAIPLWPEVLRIDIVHTNVHHAAMTGNRSKVSEKRQAFSHSELPPGPSRGSISLRIEAQTRQLIDDAAASLGKTRTEFMIDSARARAIDTLLDQRLFTLDPDKFDKFAKALDNPPAPGARLLALLQRKPVWDA